MLDHGLYDLGVSGQEYPGSELRERIERLEAELDRYRSQEQLLTRTMLSATSHAVAIRESARREGELALRKARAEAERVKAGAERKRDEAQREMMRLRRITEEMRSGLAAFLTTKVEELRSETASATDQHGELDTALGSVLEARSATSAHGSAGGSHAAS